MKKEITVDDTAETNIRRSYIGNVIRKPVYGIGMLILSIVCFFWSIIILPAGFLLWLPGIVGIATFVESLRGHYNVKCPYCNKPFMIRKNAEKHRCANCEYISIRKGEYMEALRYE